MSNFTFYYVTHNYYDIVCKIIEKLYKNKQNCLLLCDTLEQIELFDTKLWTFSKLSFIPHGSYKSINFSSAKYCHTWISDKVEFINDPKCLVTCGIQISEFSKFEKIIDVFDNVEMARQRLLYYGANDYTLWIQTNDTWQEGRL